MVSLWLDVVSVSVCMCRWFHYDLTWFQFLSVCVGGFIMTWRGFSFCLYTYRQKLKPHQVIMNVVSVSVCMCRWFHCDLTTYTYRQKLKPRQVTMKPPTHTDRNWNHIKSQWNHLHIQTETETMSSHSKTTYTYRQKLKPRQVTMKPPTHKDRNWNHIKS